MEYFAPAHIGPGFGGEEEFPNRNAERFGLGGGFGETDGKFLWVGRRAFEAQYCAVNDVGHVQSALSQF